MGAATVVSHGFRYPGPGRMAELQTAVETLAQGTVRRQMSSFLSAIDALSLAEWEEVHTRTLDLNPMFVPYVGHKAFGETYRRGELMATLKRAQIEAGVDADGELPDHIAPVLRYLDAADDLHPDLGAVLVEAVEKMQVELKKADPESPYRALLDAAREVVGEVETDGNGVGS